MLHRKGVNRGSCANSLYPTQARQWEKENLTRCSTNFKFESFFLNASAGPWKRCGGPHAASGPVVWSHWRNQTTWCNLLSALRVACYVCRLVEIYMRFSSDFWVSKCQSVCILESFRILFAQFLNLRGVLTGVTGPIVVVILPLCFSLLERLLLGCLTFQFFPPILMFWGLINLNIWLSFGKYSKYAY